MEENIDNITRWVKEYFIGYETYMRKYHNELYEEFYKNIHPPQNIGGGVMVGRSSKNTDEDYEKIFKITQDFCLKYENPIDFPKDF
jgi:hypothetical protein